VEVSPVFRRIRHWLRAAAVRRWFRSTGRAANAYEVLAYTRARWPGLTEEEQRTLVKAVKE
jgi:hypothetical protein